VCRNPSSNLNLNLWIQGELWIYLSHWHDWVEWSQIYYHLVPRILDLRWALNLLVALAWLTRTITDLVPRILHAERLCATYPSDISWVNSVSKILKNSLNLNITTPCLVLPTRLCLQHVWWW
jgi:hypothetical protein